MFNYFSGAVLVIVVNRTADHRKTTNNYVYLQPLTPGQTWRFIRAFSQKQTLDSMKLLAVALALALHPGAIQAQSYPVYIKIHNVGSIITLYPLSLNDVNGHFPHHSLADTIGLSAIAPMTSMPNYVPVVLDASTDGQGGWFLDDFTAVTLGTSDAGGGGTHFTNYFFATLQQNYFDLYYPFVPASDFASYVAISGTDSTAAYSFDGVNWVPSSGLPVASGMNAVCYGLANGNGIYVAVHYCPGIERRERENI